MTDDDADERITYVAGLSLGQASEATGFVVLERRATGGGMFQRPDAAYSVRHLARFPPGTPYAAVVEGLKAAFAEPPLQHSTLLVDQTAVGRRVFDLVREGLQGASTLGLGVTASQAPPTYDAGTFLVPKKDLVGVLQVLLQGRRLKVAPALEMAATLAEELQQFRLKAVPLTEDVVEWRERPHDDLVLAVAVAAWQGERGPGFFVAVFEPDPPIPELPRFGVLLGAGFAARGGQPSQLRSLRPPRAPGRAYRPRPNATAWNLSPGESFLATPSKGSSAERQVVVLPDLTTRHLEALPKPPQWHGG
jgi:hypothetical protein